MGGCKIWARLVAPLFGPFSSCSREEENNREEGEEEREKIKEGKEKWDFFSNLKISKKR
jgi:hypothetical protein